MTYILVRVISHAMNICDHKSVFSGLIPYIRGSYGQDCETGQRSAGGNVKIWGVDCVNITGYNFVCCQYGTYFLVGLHTYIW